MRFLPKHKLLFLVALAFFGFFSFSGNVLAANCGGATACNCGDTVTSSVVLTANLTCTGHGLVVGANGITIDGEDATTHVNHTITGDGGNGVDNGINNPSGFDNLLIENLTITSFNVGVDLVGTVNSVIQGITISSSNTGISLSSSSTGNTVSGNTANSNNNAGISLSSSASNTVSGNTANSNLSYGISLSSSASNTVSGNTANSNSIYGIYIGSSNSNTITGNTTNSNTSSGINISSSTGNNLTGNVISSNIVSNLIVSGSTTDYNNIIDTTNTVEGKPIYYFYNISNQTYDGNMVGNIGMFWCISCTNVTVKNTTLSLNNAYGIFLNNTTGSTVQNVVVNQNKGYGIYLLSSSSNTISGNIVNSSASSNPIINGAVTADNIYGIYLSSSSSNTITGNTANLNIYGIFLSSSSSSNTVSGNTINSNSNSAIYLSSSSSNTITGNTMLENARDIINSGTTNTYSSNYSSHNIISQMLTFVDGVRTKNVNDSINFDFSMFDLTATTCSVCTYTVTTSPSETISSSKASNRVTGSFTATKLGTYSLMFVITDSSSNVTKRNISYFVGSTTSKTTRYYYRNTTPSKGQPYGTGDDSKTMLLTNPVDTETWFCTAWTQNSPDELPSYPLSSLTGVDSYNWYKRTASSGAYLGIQRYQTYNTAVDTSSSISNVSSYTFINKTFNNLNWSMDYPYFWYKLTMKINAGNLSNGFTFQQTTVAQPAYADFTYSYPTTPAVKSISNADVLVLSATTPTTATSSASIVLENPLSTSASTTVTLASIQRPFTNTISTISSDGTTALTASLVGSTTSTLDAVAMDIVPSAGSVNVFLNTWTANNKQWTETGSASNITANHTISGLSNNTPYTFYVDNGSSTVYTTDGNGSLTFNYTGGYSTHTFNLNLTTIPSAPTSVSALAIGNASASVSFIAPSNNGGATITNYTVTSIPGGITNTGSASPITINGLVNSVLYQFIVTATNVVGTSVASSVSNGVAYGMGNGGLVSSVPAFTPTIVSVPSIILPSELVSTIPTPSLVAPSKNEPTTQISPTSTSNSVTGNYNFMIPTPLKLGSKGNEVKLLQKDLRLKSDGIFGKETKKAVILFQKKNGLKADGVFGAKTRAVAAWKKGKK